MRLVERALVLGRLARNAVEWPPLTADRLRSARDIVSLCALADRRMRGFNGQLLRARYLLYLFESLACTAFLETGTYLGLTAMTARELFRAPVYTVEIGRVHWLARLQAGIARVNGIRFEQGDSRDALRRWLLGPRAVDGRPMVYLDAHWYEDHPLEAELRVALERGRCVVVIDDARVSTDPAFGYDVHRYRDGTDFAIGLDALGQILPRDRVVALEPAHAASQETGLRRGTLILLIDLQAPPVQADAFAATLFRPARTGGS